MHRLPLLRISLRRLPRPFSAIRCVSSKVNHFLGSLNLTGQSLEEYIKTFNLVTHVVEPWAQKQPDHPAILLADDDNQIEQMSYSELLKQSDCLASALCNREKPPPKCSLIILPKVIPWWVINVAGSLCGMIISPGSLMLTEKDVLYRLRMCDADAIFCDSSMMEKVDESSKHVPWRILVQKNEQEEQRNLRDGWISYHQLVSEGKALKPIRKSFDGDAIAQLFFTSGTTGNPKMVPHTQAGFGVGHETTTRDWLGLNSKDIFWNFSDLGWAKAAYSSLYTPLIAGCTIFAHKMLRFDSKSVLKTLEKSPVSVVCLPPTAIRSLVQEDLSLFRPKGLRKCISAGEPLNPEVYYYWEKHTGISIQEGYGQTESTITCSSAEGIKVKPGTIGKPVHGYNLKILNENLEELGPNEVGQMAYSLKYGWPYGLFKGYLNNPEQNKKVFVKGYYLTGDKAYFDEDGYVCYVGRADDIIISAGYRIGPFEVESALIEHPAVLESAVVAYPDDLRGHVVKAFIVLKEEFQSKVESEEGRKKLVKEVQDFVKSVIAPYKYPRKVEFVEALPKTNSGKIRRVELRNHQK